MSTRLLITCSLTHYWRTGVAVVVGVAIACAVIVGSLVIGDSVRGSIRDTALARLGRIDYALVSPHFFRQKLAADMMRDFRLAGKVKIITPAVITRGAVSSQTTDATVPSASVVGVDDSFWGLWPERAKLGRAKLGTAKLGTAKLPLSRRQAAVSQSLARDLGARLGDSILVSVDKQSAVPGGTLFEKRSREDTVSSLRLEIAAVLPDDGPGGFKLDTGTESPRNVFVSREWLCEQIGKPEMANALLVESSGSGDIQAGLGSALTGACTLLDYDLVLIHSSDNTYTSLQSDSLLLPESVVKTALDAAAEVHAHSALTSVYLATTIRKHGQSRGIPYSIIAAAEPLWKHPKSVWLNDWAAKDLQAKIGDRIDLVYLVSRPDGSYREDSITLTFTGTVPMTGLGGDRSLTPAFEGITNAERIDQWKAPFPVDMNRIRPADEDYWNRYRTAPKAFVSFDTARQLWRNGSSGNQAGDWVTSVRMSSSMTVAGLDRRVGERILARLRPEQQGMVFRPLREAAIAASAGTTDFGQLFLGMSLFLVIAGAGLAGTLMRLSAERRASEAGIMMACGFDARGTRRVLFGEGLCLTVIGVALGVPLGVLYAAGIIAALRSWWIGAVGTSALWLHLTAASVIIGAISSLIVGAISVYIGVSRLTRNRVLDLLAGWQSMAVLPVARGHARTRLLFALSLILAILLLVLPAFGVIQPEGAFFGGGALLLIAALGYADLTLARALSGKSGAVSIRMLALRSAAANRSRSLLVIGLIAAAGFMIVAVAANTRNFSRIDYTRKDSGTGGFALRAISSLPIRYDFGTPAGRAALGFPPEDEAIFKDVRVYQLNMISGDDVSCLNLAKPAQPRVLWVGKDFIDRGGFSLTLRGPNPGANPWTALTAIGADSLVPVFGDADSVMWSLHSGLGKTLDLKAKDGRPCEARIEGLIHGSIFAGELVGYGGRTVGGSSARYFLIEAPTDKVDKVAASLRQNLGDVGLEVRTTQEILNSYASVRNTYLSVFLALGGLGLLLGTFGLIAMILRGALERRREFALMLAAGLTSGHLSRLLILENAGLLIYGLACGTVAALVAVAPHVLSTQSGVGWGMIFIALAIIAIAGLVSCIVAAKHVVKGALVEALREE